MIKHIQTVLYDGKTSFVGNCLQASMSCYFDMRVEDVPPFHCLFDCEPNDFWNYALDLWLELKGVKRICIAEDPIINGILKSSNYYFATGVSPRNVGHIVIYKDGKLFHDTHPEQTGIEVHGFFYLELIPNK